jgi:hypothetical protein
MYEARWSPGLRQGDILGPSDLIREHGSVRAALMATHPDHGGDPDEFAAVQAAR